MADTVITKEQIRKLITQEHLQPQDLFDKNDLALWRESMNYADKVVADLNREDEKKAAKEKNPNEKYLSPATNPYIKTA